MGICGTCLLEGPGQHLLKVLLQIPFNYLSWSKVRIENCVVTQMVFQNFKNIFQARTCLKDPGFFKQRYFTIIPVEVWKYNSFKDNFKVFFDAKAF